MTWSNNNQNSKLVYSHLEPNTMNFRITAILIKQNSKFVRNPKCWKWNSSAVDNSWRLALLEYGKDWLVQNQDNVTEVEIGSWCWQSSVTVKQHYNAHQCAVSKVDTLPNMLLHVARMQNTDKQTTVKPLQPTTSTYRPLPYIDLVFKRSPIQCHCNDILTP